MSAARRKAPPRSRRGRRHIDVVAGLDREGLMPDKIRRLDQVWPEIVRKSMRVLGQHARTRWEGETQFPVGVELTGEEAVAMYHVLQFLMDDVDTDSLRRDMRDDMLARDYVFHKEVLGHRAVLGPICHRWGVSETVAKQAVRRYRDEARQFIGQARAFHEQFLRDFGASFLKKEGIEASFERAMSHQLRNEAEEYRTGKDTAPRPRKRRRKSAE